MANSVKKFLDYSGVTKLVELMSAYIAEYVGQQFTAHANEQYHDIKVGDTTHASSQHLGKIEFVGTGATTVTLSGDENNSSKISISSADEHVTSVDKHYTPSGGSDKLTGADKTKKTITSLTVDAAGHVTGATLSNIAFPVTSVSEGTSTENYVKLTVNPTNSDVKISLNDADLKDAIDGINGRIDSVIAGGISFKGVVTALPSKPQNGDLIIIGNADLTVSGKTYKKDYEYVYSNGSWYELGDSDKNAKQIASHDDRLDALEDTVITNRETNFVTRIDVGDGLHLDSENDAGNVSIRLSAATENKLGGIKIGYEGPAEKTYPVQLDVDNHAYVAVPWVNTDTTNIIINEPTDTNLAQVCTDTDHVHYFVDVISSDGDTINYTRKGFGCLSATDISNAFLAAFPQA